MKKRIGNDIQFTWHIYRKSGDTQTPESFEGKEVEVKLISPLKQPVSIEDVNIATGVVTFTFRGKHQVTPGNYIAVLQENRGEDGMVTIDVVNAVTLVPHSYMEDDEECPCGTVEVESVEIESEISAGSGTPIDAYTKAETDALLAGKVDAFQIQGGYTASRYVTGTFFSDNSDQQGRVRSAAYEVGGITLVDLNGNMAILQINGVLQLNGKAIATEDDTALLVDGGDYNSQTKEIELKHGNTVLARIDARVFIKDGMVDSVVIENGYIVITFNTDAGKQAISLALTDIFNPANYYDKTAMDALLAGKQDTISDLPAIRSGAAAGATAVQPADLTPIDDSLDDVEYCLGDYIKEIYEFNKDNVPEVTTEPVYTTQTLYTTVIVGSSAITCDCKLSASGQSFRALWLPRLYYPTDPGRIVFTKSGKATIYLVLRTNQSPAPSPYDVYLNVYDALDNVVMTVYSRDLEYNSSKICTAFTCDVANGYYIKVLYGDSQHAVWLGQIDLEINEVKQISTDVHANSNAIAAIEQKIPAQASASNQLADKDFVNSSIATATATYRGSYNLVSDLSLTVSATQQQIADALATKMEALSITPDNNDYCFVQIPTTDATPTEIARIDRYKYDGTAWAYEYSLNNSSFTAAQWAALNSGITSGLVAKLSALPTNSELITSLNGKANTSDLAPVATSGNYDDLTGRPAVDNTPTPDSNNIVKSGGVYGTTPSITNTDAESDLDFSDEGGNVLLRLSYGHIKTKNFDSLLFSRINSAVDYDNEVVATTSANASLSYKQHRSIGSFDFDFKWVGGCLAENGRIYGITNGNRQVLEINPETDTYCLFGNLSHGSFKWTGCGIGKNGMIYGYPRSANSVLIIDPITQGVQEVDLGTHYEQDHHYGGCIVGDYMYLAPRTANHILKIDLRTWQTERLGENIITDTMQYNACIYHPNGYVYFIPSVNAKILKLNPLNDAITELGSVLQSCSVYGASVAPSNKCIYGFTGHRTNGGILKIDVENNDTISFIHEGTVGTGYYSTELALNGKLYSGVGNGTTVWELDPVNDSVSVVDTISDTDGGDYNEAKCAGGVLAENGSIYLIPAKGRHIYKLEFDGQIIRTMPRKVLMSNYFSNY